MRCKIRLYNLKTDEKITNRAGKLMIKIHEINAKSLLRKMKRMDSWFISAYGMNLYRGCEHNCVYCDGRSEKYQVEGDFGNEIYVKTNALDILRKELDFKRKRKPFKKGYICLGGGVGDSYQPIEKKYKITREVLNFLSTRDFPVHILTKSDLVLRDIDILKRINEKKRVLVSFSISSACDDISRVFEPRTTLPSKRLEAVKKIKENGIAAGVFLLPVIPFITDTLEIMNKTLKEIKKSNADYVIFGGMTLKEGRQKDFFYKALKKFYSTLIPEYERIYKGDVWGNTTKEYYISLEQTFSKLIQKYNIPIRIPQQFYTDYLEENDRVMVILEHIDYILKSQNKKSPYSYAVYSISKLKKPVSEIKHKLCSLKGVGEVTERIILEILDKGKSTYLEKLHML